VTSIEAELELGEVALDIRSAYRFVSTRNGRLEITKQSVHPFQRRDFFRLLGFAGRDDGCVRCATARDGTKAAQPIRDDMRSSDEVIACHGLDRGAIMSFDEMDQNTARSTFGRGLHRDHERDLVGASPATFAAVGLTLLAAENGIIHLDAAPE